MHIVFDIGGTSLRAARVSANLMEIEAIETVETPNFLQSTDKHLALDALLARMSDIASSLAAQRPLELVCVGFPGPIDGAGNLMAAPTIWGGQSSQRLPLRNRLEALWPSARIELLNDVTAAGYAYASELDADFLIVTVGSGIGSKLFIAGEPVLGPHFRGGEIGHMRVDFAADALTCDCGGSGHLGAIASGRGVLRTSMRRAATENAFLRSSLHALCRGSAEKIENSHIVTAFRDGDEYTREIVRECSVPLAQSLVSMHLQSGLERFVLIGGFAQALGDDYRIMLCDLARSTTWDNGFDWTSGIFLSRSEDLPGLRGAAAYLHRRHRATDGLTDGPSDR
jgi:predicted NBD/HSP70 family sugar kinase